MFFGERQLVTSEQVELALLIAPIFSVYVTAIVRDITRRMQEPYDNTRMHIAFFLLAIIGAATFSATVPVTLCMYLNGTITTFANLKSVVGIVETALGVYTGAIVDALFASRKETRGRKVGLHVGGSLGSL